MIHPEEDWLQKDDEPQKEQQEKAAAVAAAFILKNLSRGLEGASFPRRGSRSKPVGGVRFFPEVDHLAQETIVALAGSAVGVEPCLGSFPETDSGAAELGHGFPP
jgi:hypothetical protein